MKRLSIALLCLILASCAKIRPTASDPIDMLVSRLNSSHGLWINGIYPIIDLPPDAKPGEVVNLAIKITEFDQGHIKTYKMQEIREVRLNTGQLESYQAALIESDLGTKIFLFKPERNNRWWTRFYDVQREEQNN